MKYIQTKQISSSPSYYYQHISSANQLDNYDYDDNRSLSSFQNQQQHYQLDVNHNTIQPKSINKNQESKKNQQILQQHHPDRSLKLNQPNTKSTNFFNKNKSLSSPSNHPHQKKNFKKHKPIQQLHHHQKQTTKNHIKPKKIKQTKQKKISNGSSSTDHTKTHPNKSKKPKVQTKKITQKGHNASKSSHNVSQQSNQFLVLGQNLYDYQDMSRVETAKHFYDRKVFVNELEKQRSKKVKFNQLDGESHGRSKYNQHSLSIYDPARLQKKVNKTIGKIEKYILGFMEAQIFNVAKQQALQDTENLSIEKKLQLYQQLIRDSQLSKQIQVENKITQTEKMDDIIKLSIEKVQKKSQKLSEMYQQEQGLISKWKNSKLHQLSTAKKILQRLMQEDHLHHHSKQIPHLNKYFSNEMEQIDDIESDPLFLLEKQLQQIMSQEYYPQLKRHTLSLRKSLNQLLKNQTFPEPKLSTQSEVVEQSRMQNTQNYFTPNGVLWFFDKFFTFITQKPNYIPQLVEKLNEGFGFDVETKKVIAKTKDYEKWYDFFGEGQKSVNRKSLIDQSIMDQFEQQIIKPDPELSKQTQRYMHYFNKAIIDSFNEQFHRIRPFYPYGQPLQNIQKAGKYFEISNESIFYFFQKSKYHIYTNYITYFAGLILPQGQQETKQTKQYNITKQIKLTSNQLLYDWEFYHCLLPVAKLSTFQDLYQLIQLDIYNQLVIDLLKIKKQK